jgi:excisionase family DNA binding protein
MTSSRRTIGKHYVSGSGKVHTGCTPLVRPSCGAFSSRYSGSGRSQEYQSPGLRSSRPESGKCIVRYTFDSAWSDRREEYHFSCSGAVRKLRGIFRAGRGRWVSPPMSIAAAAFPITPNHFEPLLTPADAGSYLGIHQKTAIRMAREGSIPALRLGKHWRFRRSDLESWVGAQIQSACQPEAE